MKTLFDKGGLEISEIGDAHALSINIPDTKLNILTIRCSKGMLFCGIFDRTVIEKLDFPAAVFSAPAFSDMMNNTPVYISQAAKAIGITADMTGREIIKQLS